MKNLNIEAKVDNLPQVLMFIDSYLEEADCPMKAQMQIDISVEVSTLIPEGSDTRISRSAAAARTDALSLYSETGGSPMTLFANQIRT